MLVYQRVCLWMSNTIWLVRYNNHKPKREIVINCSYLPQLSYRLGAPHWVITNGINHPKMMASEVKKQTIIIEVFCVVFIYHVYCFIISIITEVCFYVYIYIYIFKKMAKVRFFGGPRPTWASQLQPGDLGGCTQKWYLTEEEWQCFGGWMALLTI